MLLRDLAPRLVRPLSEDEDLKPQPIVPPVLTRKLGPKRNRPDFKSYYALNRELYIERASEWNKNNRARINKRRRETRAAKRDGGSHEGAADSRSGGM